MEVRDRTIIGMEVLVPIGVHRQTGLRDLYHSPETMLCLLLRQIIMAIEQRNLVLDTNRTIGNLINATNLSVIIPAGKTLIVNNNITQTSGLDNLLQIQASTTLANGSIIYNNSQSSTVRGTLYKCIRRQVGI